MIEVINLRKSFDDVTAVDNVSVQIEDGHVFGLIGTNGAGKSTLIRLVSGVLKPDEGKVLVDGEPVYDNPEVKARIFSIYDEPYFFRSGTPKDMLKLYQTYYPGFQTGKWFSLMEKFSLSPKRKIHTFSKGMRKLLCVICGVCANTKYLLCDETFDGLDPVMRQAVKALFVREMDERGLTPVIATHNLRELEDICEYVGLLHRGGILLEKDMDDMKLSIHKLQCALREESTLERLRSGLDIVTMDRRGSLCTLTVRGERERVEAFLGQLDLPFYEILPLSLEEIFISETEVKGYDVKKLLF